MSNVMKGFKMHTKNKLCLTVLLGLLTIAEVISAEDFTVTEIVEIGPVNLRVGEGPMKFSPSGDELAYFVGKTLILSNIDDGSKREIIQLEMKPLQFEWLSIGEVVVLEYKSLGGPNDYRRLTRIDINTGETLTLHEHYRDKDPDTPVTERILSLRKTLHNQFSYKLGSELGEVIKFPSSNYKEIDQNTALSRDYYLEWGKEREVSNSTKAVGLFKVSADGSTSTRIGPFFGVHHLFPPVYSHDLSYVMAGGKILKVEAGTFVVLEPMFVKPEDMDACSFFWSEFNPVMSEELMFHRSCYRDAQDGEVYRDFIGLFNIDNNEITLLDELVGMENCQAPVYAPDGLSIAFVSDGIAYVLRRKWK